MSVKYIPLFVGAVALLVFPGCELFSAQEEALQAVQTLQEQVTDLEEKNDVYQEQLADMEASKDSLSLQLSRMDQAVQELKYEQFLYMDAEKYCSADPYILDNGADMYPIDPAYHHLTNLGQMFTAKDCGEERLMSMSVIGDDLLYERGIRLRISEAPSAGFVSVVEALEFTCVEEEYFCTEWLFDDAIHVDDIFRLMPYADEIASDDCTHCG